MNGNRPIPDFFVSTRNTVIQIIFTVFFAYVFILVYHPFGSQAWFEVNTGQFAFYAGFVVVLGMVVVLISRTIMIQIRRRHTITIAGYTGMIVLEILAMTGFYMMIQKVFLKDVRFWFEVYYMAIFNTTLILLIPYLISLLYFAWLDKKRNFDILLENKTFETEKNRFVHFKDENGETRLSIQLENLLYLEASENYVTIHYINQSQPARMLLRNSMKRMELMVADLPIVRCHRSYMVNINRVRLAKKTRTGLSLELDSPVATRIPVTETYRKSVVLKMDAKQ